MNRILNIIIGIGILTVLLILSGTFYTLPEYEQAIITQFGKPVGTPITMAGLHIKIPFIQKVHYFEKRILDWDGYPDQIPTRDKKLIWVDTTARWRIKDPLKFMQTVHNYTRAQTILDDILDATIRNYIRSNNLTEVVRTTNNIISQADVEATPETQKGLERINLGRDNIRKMIIKDASSALKEYGIELIDVRIKRINYVEEVRRKVFDRMIAERKKAAEKYRSEGRGQKAKIEGKMNKELQEIQSEAYKMAQQIKGKADAKVTRIYAGAYSKDPDFYAFLKTLETYKKSVDKNTTLLLSTDTEYYKLFKAETR